MIMTTTFANMTAYAQGTCAVPVCSDMNTIILSLDAMILASIIILLVFASPFTCRNMTPPLPCLPS